KLSISSATFPTSIRSSLPARISAPCSAAQRAKSSAIAVGFLRSILFMDAIYRRSGSEQEIPLRHGQHRRWLAGQQFPVGSDLVRLGIDLDFGRGVVVDHRGLADPPAGVLDGDQRLVERVALLDPGIE